MNPHFKQTLITVLGWLFLVLGVLGLFLPILQGVLFLIIGLYLLSRTSPWAKRWLDQLRTKYPKIAKKSDEVIKKFKWKSTP